MPTCAICHKTNQFLRIEQFGICSDCYPQHGHIVAEAVLGIATEAERRERLKKPVHRLESINESLEHCARLEPYGQLPDLPDPAHLKADLIGARTAIIEEVIRDKWLWARERFKDARGFRGKLAPYEKALAELQDLLDHTDDTTLIDKAVVVMRAERDRLGFEIVWKEAELAEAQGKTKRALELYIEAQFTLQNDITPDSYQDDLVQRVAAKIAALR